MPTAADLGALFSIGPTLRRTIWGINGNSDVGRNKPVRALSAGLAFPAHRLPETPTLADAGRSYSGLRRDMYNDESRSLGTNKITSGAILC